MTLCYQYLWNLQTDHHKVSPLHLKWRRPWINRLIRVVWMSSRRILMKTYYWLLLLMTLILSTTRRPCTTLRNPFVGWSNLHSAKGVIQAGICQCVHNQHSPYQEAVYSESSKFMHSQHFLYQEAVHKCGRMIIPMWLVTCQTFISVETLLCCLAWLWILCQW